MKIAIINQFTTPEAGGHEINLANLLYKKGHEPIIITSEYKTPNLTNYKYIKADKKKDKELCPFEIVRLKTVFIYSEFPIVKGMNKIIADFQPDIINIHEFFQYTSYKGFKIGKKNKIPIVLTQHCYYFPPSFINRLGMKITTKLWGKKLIENSDSLIAIAESSSKFLKEVSKNPTLKVNIIPTPLELDQFLEINPDFIENPKNNTFRILYVGRVDERKGLKYLVDATSILTKRFNKHQIVLDIVGKGKDFDKLKSYAEEKNINARFHGFVEHKNISKFYKRANVFVLPTITKEPFGNVAVEALASGIPVIASKLGGLVNIIQEGTGFLVQPKNADEIANAITKFLQNPLLLKKYSKNAKKLGIKFAHVPINSIIDIFQDLI
ncbi:MAG: glycosyltransferase family 4 protein [Candidatus Heimdallarchaeum endolithica]|uniref:Glycosyltransferase family 4 protein n=1 Tax=Candidatus Heimdallarchaeum endolithica TaxID=2876572 RepID=A0A9Y1FP26_9ARCH|nr:MAG: glycosyltransferase family 4 protein [Candidatus Heimdallarchaeum endolithica]